MSMSKADILLDAILYNSENDMVCRDATSLWELHESLRQQLDDANLKIEKLVEVTTSPIRMDMLVNQGDQPQ